MQVVWMHLGSELLVLLMVPCVAVFSEWVHWWPGCARTQGLRGLPSPCHLRFSPGDLALSPVISMASRRPGASQELRGLQVCQRLRRELAGQGSSTGLWVKQSAGWGVLGPHAAVSRPGAFSPASGEACCPRRLPSCLLLLTACFLEETALPLTPLRSSALIGSCSLMGTACHGC